MEDGNQLNLFSKWVLKLITKKSEKEFFNETLLERVTLSEDEKRKYGFCLRKEDLLRYFNKTEIKLGERQYMNKGVPQMLLTTLIKYSKKPLGNLFVSDLIVLQKSINEIFPEGVGSLAYRKFSKANKLHFGFSQYTFMEMYLRSLN